MSYLKTQENREYRIAKDPKWLEWLAPDSGITRWTPYAVVPQNRKYIKRLRQSRMGAQCECLLDDDRWYQKGLSQILQLCEEEKIKERQSRKSTSSDVTSGNGSNSGVSAVVSGIASSALDAYERKTAEKAAKMAEEREAWQAKRQREREEERARYAKERRKNDLETLVWGGSFKKASYSEKIRTLVDQYFYDHSLEDHEVIGKILETAYIKSSNPKFKQWKNKVDSVRPQKPVSVAQRFNPPEGQDPKIYDEEFVMLFPDPAPRIEAEKLAKEKKAKQEEELKEKKAKQKEELRKKALEADEQDKANGVGRWDYTKVRKNKWTAFALSLFLGFYGVQYFYMGKKIYGFAELGLTLLCFFYIINFDITGLFLGVGVLLFWLISTFKILLESERKFKSRYLPLYSFKEPKFDDK